MTPGVPNIPSPGPEGHDYPSPESSPPRGAGCPVAIIDTGINPDHPHVGGCAGGVAITGGVDGPLAYHDDWLDRLGHGTAVAGAVRLFAPEAALWAINVFDADARAPHGRLVAAIDWAIARGCVLVNLSVGTADPIAEAPLAAAVARAAAAGALVVAPAPAAGGLTWPAAAPGALGVRADMALAPELVAFADGDPAPWRALGAPRPLRGANQARNFKGGSFAAARVTGMLAAAWQAGVREPAALRAWLWRRARTIAKLGGAPERGGGDDA